MKKFILIATLLSSNAYAESPLITKLTNNGYQASEWMRSESCDVYEDRVEVRMGYGQTDNSLVTSEVHKISLYNIKKAIAKAAQEPLEKGALGVCDTPSTEIRAYVKINEENSEEHVLYLSGTCFTQKTTKKGAYSDSLIALVNRFCPTTIK